MKSDTLSIPLLSSIAVHGCAILLASFLVQPKAQRPQDYFSVRLFEIPSSENKAASQPAEPEPTAPVGAVSEKKPAKSPNGASKTPVMRSAPALAPTKQLEELKAPESKTAPAQTEDLPSAMPDPNGEGGGSPAGTIASSDKGEFGIGRGRGSGIGGGGSAAFGLGHSAGAPGRAAQPIFRTSREAKPIQAARANYPPMALRAGLESDVTLKIEVDSQGNVTRAEITKSGGGGFDEEALKAVKQSRFEPAQRDGENIAAEFTYIYRFRIRR